jgi:hypothetical protein
VTSPGQQESATPKREVKRTASLSPWLWVGLAAAGLAAIWIAALLR